MFEINKTYESNKTYSFKMLLMPKNDRKWTKLYKCDCFFRSTIRSREHILQTLLYCVQLVSGYLLMLIIMTYNIYVLLATIFGLCAGYFVCQWRVPLGKGGCQRACHNAQLQTASRDFNEPELEPLNTGMEEQDQRETKI